MRYTIKLKIQIAIGVIIATVSAVQATLSITQLRNETTQEVTNQMTAIGHATSNYIGDWLKTRSDMMLANEPLIANQDNVDRELLLTKHAGHFLSVYGGFSDGTIAYGDKTEDWPAGYDPRTRPWYQNAMKTNQLTITEPYQDFDGSLVVSLAKSFKGKKQGVLAADLTVTHIIQQVLNLKLDNDGYALLLDGNNKIVAYKDEALSQKPATQLDDELTPQLLNSLEQQQSIGTITLTNGQEKLIAVSPIAGTDWKLVVVEDKTLAYASIGEQAIFVIIASIILYIIIAVIATLVINNLLRPLKDLSVSVQQLSQGNGDLTQRIDVQRMDEIGELATYMNQFLAQLRDMIQGIAKHSLSLKENADLSAQQTQQANQKVASQQNDVNQIATAIHEMSATSAEVASHAEMTASAAQASTTACEEGQQVIGENRQAITSFSQSSTRCSGSDS
ncbi:methyl-accepting chemotaxis protein PctB [Photobacterium damselae subsp. piscicida]|nr:methyl-accepting chemotaxis protein PctB [Photobacterium damselae subsp. piscicida]